MTCKLVTDNTGHAPHGNLNCKLLIRMVKNSKPKAA